MESNRTSEETIGPPTRHGFPERLHDNLPQFAGGVSNRIQNGESPCERCETAFTQQSKMLGVRAINCNRSGFSYVGISSHERSFRPWREDRRGLHKATVAFTRLPGTQPLTYSLFQDAVN